MDNEQNNQNIRQTICSHLIAENISNRITSLRYLLMVLIVFLHVNPKFIYDFDAPAYYKIIIQFIWFLSDSAVPVYLLFSGYLQFKKSDTYFVLLKKRFFSVFLPYFIWITLAILFYNGVKFICSHINALSFIFYSKENLSNKWTFFDYLRSYFIYFSDRPLKNPFVQQFWFLRDLMIYILLSPIFVYLIRHFPISFLFFLVIVYFGNLPLCFTVTTRGLLYYILGYYFANYDFDFFEFSDKIKFWEYIILITILFYLVYFYNCPIECILTAVFCLFWFKISGYLYKNEKVYIITCKLKTYSFFLFAIHMPFLCGIITKITFEAIENSKYFSVFIIIQYFVAALLTTIIGTGLGIILHRFMPRVFKTLNGGRG